MINFVVLSLCVWRLSSLLARESGPFEVLEKLRLFLGVEYDERGDRQGTNVFSRAIVCVWCNSIWVSLAFAPSFSHSIIGISVLTFALSAAAIIIDKVVTNGDF